MPFIQAHAKPSASNKMKIIIAMNAPNDKRVNTTAKGKRKIVSTSKIKNRMA